MQLWEGPAAYSDMTQLGEGQIGILFENGDEVPACSLSTLSLIQSRLHRPLLIAFLSLLSPLSGWRDVKLLGCMPRTRLFASCGVREQLQANAIYPKTSPTLRKRAHVDLEPQSAGWVENRDRWRRQPANHTLCCAVFAFTSITGSHAFRGGLDWGRSTQRIDGKAGFLCWRCSEHRVNGVEQKKRKGDTERTYDSQPAPEVVLLWTWMSYMGLRRLTA
jgi:hypothetical protein